MEKVNNKFQFNIDIIKVPEMAEKDVELQKKFIKKIGKRKAKEKLTISKGNL